MKRITAAVLFVFCFSAVFAHGPDLIAVETDVLKSKVKVMISHKVRDASSHFIGRIEVSVNGKLAVRQDAVAQTSASEQRVVYTLPGLKEGDTLEIFAVCNKGGDMRKKFTVKDGGQKEKK